MKRTLLLLLAICGCSTHFPEPEPDQLKQDALDLRETAARLDCTVRVTGLSDRYLMDSFIAMSPQGTPYNAETMLAHINRLVDICLERKKGGATSEAGRGGPDPDLSARFALPRGRE